MRKANNEVKRDFHEFTSLVRFDDPANTRSEKNVGGKRRDGWAGTKILGASRSCDATEVDCFLESQSLSSCEANPQILTQNEA